MGQSLELEVDAKSNVPQAMDKAKQAVASFSKQAEDVNKKTTQKAKEQTEKSSGQIEGIQKRFSNSFKDIFLSVLGPMALFTGAMALIGRIIEENRKKQEDAKQAAIDGTNELISSEERYYQTKQSNEKKAAEDAEQAKLSREQTTFEFLSKDPRGYKIYQDYVAGRIGDVSRNDVGDRDRKYNARYDAEVQARVFALIAEDAKKNPIKLKTAKDSEDKFKGPEGFSNVIGVGPNPVIEAMNAQLEEAQKQTALLEKIANPAGGVQTDFTKDSK